MTACIGEAQTYESPYLELTQATKKAGAGDPKADARVDRVDYSLPELAGGALCSYAQSRAMQLTQAGDRSSYSTFTCDQYESNIDQMTRGGNVDPSALNMSFNVNLGNYPGRGLSLPVSLNYSAKLWRIRFQDLIPCQPCTASEDVSGFGLFHCSKKGKFHLPANSLESEALGGKKGKKEQKKVFAFFAPFCPFCCLYTFVCELLGTLLTAPETCQLSGDFADCADVPATRLGGGLVSATKNHQPRPGRPHSSGRHF